MHFLLCKTHKWTHATHSQLVKLSSDLPCQRSTCIRARGRQRNDCKGIIISASEMDVWEKWCLLARLRRKTVVAAMLQSNRNDRVTLERRREDIFLAGSSHRDFLSSVSYFIYAPTLFTEQSSRDRGIASHHLLSLKALSIQSLSSLGAGERESEIWSPRCLGRSCCALSCWRKAHVVPLIDNCLMITSIQSYQL